MRYENKKKGIIEEQDVEKEVGAESCIKEIYGSRSNFVHGNFAKEIEEWEGNIFNTTCKWQTTLRKVLIMYLRIYMEIENGGFNYID